LNIYEVAYGFIKVANETMCRPIRNLTQGKGIDPRNNILCIFGGAGAQHACAIATKLGITKIFIHEFAGILSAFGLAKANVVEDNLIPFN
jgi:5-oxoprolinase (ATP-hydrolysing)